MKTRIRSFIMAMLLVLSMTATTLAAGTDSAVSIDLQAEQLTDLIVLNVNLTAEHITNGRVVINYDAQQVKLERVNDVDKCVTSVNDTVSGELAVAWVGGNFSGTVNAFKVVFRLVGDDEIVGFDGEIVELYSNGVDLIDNENPVDSVDVTVGENAPVNPNPPAPVNPTPKPPVDDPDDGKEDEGKDDETKPGINLNVPELTEEKYNSIVAKYPDAQNHWAEEAIVKAVNAGLFNGTGDNTFTPNGNVTRGMFAELLYRLSGKPAVDGNMPFSDVTASNYYYNAVIWAYSNGIVTGVSDTEFAPEAKVSREQMVTMLYRFAKFINDDVTASTSLKGFADNAAVNSWAVEAMSWAVAEGIITGADGKLSPADNSTRAQVATILVRYAGL